ncbi:MAG TPA: UDP-N-acetylmuramate--L-alanine ligase [Gemmatimonadaceae bacterium]|nr:UDP-N-acetylmuramate--L-alanine ligase [Gemmatimonadaceae bacterium]
MSLLDPADSRPIHFIGIAGAGMSALADLFARRGATVTGCDASTTGHDPAHIQGVRAVVVSSAIRPDLPEVVAARAAGLPVIRRAEALAEAVAGGTVIGIAGTHGKTTTTVMTTETLTAAGKSPTGVVGGRVAEWNGNLRYGSLDLFVVEADEYDRSFLALTPTVAVVTNIEADHLDIYRDLDDIRSAFATFVRPARWIILCADDPGANSLPTPPTAEVVRYGLTSGDARLTAHSVERASGGSQFTVVYDGDTLGSITLSVPGDHNIRNALGAIASGIAVGVPLASMAPGLANFHGVERRFQRLGEAKGVAVVDDYAHHPTEIRATLHAARAAYPGRRIIAAFQPHLFTRTRDFAGDFGQALARSDAIFLTEIYPAREQPLPGVTSDLIATAAAQAGKPVAWRGVRNDLASALATAVRPGDVVITLGAGDITKTGPELLTVLGRNGAAP